MSTALAHFAFGAAMTTLLIVALSPTVPYPRTVVLAGGAWAMVPDLHWVSPVAREELRAFHYTPFADLCWFHRTLDRADPGDSKAVAALALACFLVATVLAERRDYRSLASVGAADEAHRADESSE
jgi:hypothetical protein